MLGVLYTVSEDGKEEASTLEFCANAVELLRSSLAAVAPMYQPSASLASIGARSETKYS